MNQVRNCLGTRIMYHVTNATHVMAHPVSIQDTRKRRPGSSGTTGERASNRRCPGGFLRWERPAGRGWMTTATRTMMIPPRRVSCRLRRVRRAQANARRKWRWESGVGRWRRHSGAGNTVNHAIRTYFTSDLNRSMKLHDNLM